MATRTECDRNTTATIRLAVWEIEDVRQVLLRRSREKHWTQSHRENCAKAREWLRTLIEGKDRIADVELTERRWVLLGIGRACIADGLGDVGADILNQVQTGGGA
ncbi:MAG: hypothetical protein KGO96_12705 [Elusimicrobia bacterium]|nr:hypothetical protein [Elusimicrobiota bacterium]